MKKVYDPQGSYEVKKDKLNLTVELNLPKDYELKKVTHEFDASSNLVNAVLVVVRIKDKNTNGDIKHDLRNKPPKAEPILVKPIDLSKIKSIGHATYDTKREDTHLAVLHDQNFKKNEKQCHIRHGFTVYIVETKPVRKNTVFQ